jgi:hypothetical protein
MNYQENFIMNCYDPNKIDWFILNDVIIGYGNKEQYQELEKQFHKEKKLNNEKSKFHLYTNNINEIEMLRTKRDWGLLRLNTVEPEDIDWLLDQLADIQNELNAHKKYKPFKD